MQISPIQQIQYQTANPSFQKLRGIKFVENTVRADGRNYVLKANKFFDTKKLTKLIEDNKKASSDKKYPSLEISEKNCTFANKIKSTPLGGPHYSVLCK